MGKLYKKFSLQTIPVIGRVFPRRFQLYCVGTAKSGTHSIASIFSPQFRSRHEPYSEQAIRIILGFSEGTIEQSTMDHFVIRKERQLRLEVNSSQLNYYFLETLITHFPNAQFLLTIRDPYSWLTSYINHQLGRKKLSLNWQKFRDYRFKNSIYTFSPEETILKHYHLYPLDSYLSYWVRHNQKVIQIVPKDKLLIIRTDQISEQLDQIADFVNIDRKLVHKNASHEYRAVKSFNILEQIDTNFLAKKIAYHCQPLKDQFFLASESDKNTT